MMKNATIFTKKETRSRLCLTFDHVDVKKAGVQAKENNYMYSI